MNKPITNPKKKSKEITKAKNKRKPTACQFLEKNECSVISLYHHLGEVQHKITDESIKLIENLPMVIENKIGSSCNTHHVKLQTISSNK